MKSTSVCLALALSTLPLHAAPQWIWTSKAAKDGETATFRKTFNVTGEVKSAKIDFTCDNGATAFINGRKVAENSNWDQPSSSKLKEFLKPGENEIRIDAKNSGPVAGLVAVVTLRHASGGQTLIETGPDWLASATGGTAFQPAVAVAKYGDGPWGKALIGKTDDASSLPDPTQIQVPPVSKRSGFTASPRKRKARGSPSPRTRKAAC